MKLIHKLIAGILVVLALIWTAGLYTYKSGYMSLQNTYINDNEALAMEMMDSIDRAIYNRVEKLMSYANDVMLRKTVIKSNQTFGKMHDVYSVINQRDREWTSLPKVQVTPFMQGLIDNTLSDEFREITDFYSKYYGYKLFGEMFVTNKYGANVAQTGKTTDYRQDDEEWWQLAKKEELYLRDVRHEESADIYSIDIAARINDDNGDFIGVIKTVLNIEEVLDILRNKTRGGIYPEYKSIKILLLTSEGNVIFSSDNKDRFLDNASYLLPGPKSKSIGRSSYFISRDGHDRLLMTSARSKGHMGYKGFNWMLLLAVDEKDAFAPLIQLRNKIAWGSFGVTLLALLTGVFMFARIAGNVRRLRDAAVKIGNGDLSLRIEVGSNDEIGDLTLTFNKMVQSLKERTGALTDEILRRKAAEEKSENLAREWVKTFDSIPDLISIHSNDLRITRANQALADYLGLKKEELIGKYCYDVFHGKKEPIPECPHCKTVETRKPVTVEICDRKTASHLMVSTSPVFNKQHEVIGTVHIVKDITEIKKLEEQLRHTQKMEAVGELAGGVAHEFNNILSAIINYGYLLRDMSSGTPEIGNFIDKILALAEKASRTSQNLLTYSRNQYLELKPSDLNMILKNAGQLISDFKGIDIEFESFPSEQPLMIMANEHDIKQCIINLARNAVEVMSGGGTLTIRTGAIEMDASFMQSRGFGAPGLYALLSVSDTGMGIDDKTSKKMFVPFFTTKEVGKGTGLGLSIVYGITKQHSGFIEVESKTGYGSTFILYFPIIHKDTLASMPKEAIDNE